MHLKRTRRDDNIVSPQGLVWHRNQERNNKTQRGYTLICEPGSNKCTMRKPRLPPARSLEITECKPHGQHSHRFMDTIQKPVMTQSCGKWKVEQETSETWRENGSKVRRKETTGAQEPLRVLSRVLFQSSALMKVLVLLKEILVSRIRQDGVVLFWRSARSFFGTGQ